MSFHPQTAPVRPPSRRGTPSADGPIPFFGGPDTSNSGAETDFFSAMGNSEQHAVIHQTSSAQYLPQQQQQQPVYNAPLMAHGVPPRSATAGPAEYQYQQAVYGTQPMVDPYRSASVVYPGYGGAQYGAQQNAAVQAQDGAAFFDQLASASQPQQATMQPPVDQSGYYAQYSQPAVAVQQQQAYAGYGETVDPTVSGATAQVQQTASADPVYDEAMGQYYDPQSGQYYDNDSGTWYYPQAAAGYGTEYTQSANEYSASATIPAADATAGYVQPTQPEIADGAAFFDNLSAAAADVSAQHTDYSADPTQQHQQQPAAVVTAAPIAAQEDSTVAAPLPPPATAATQAAAVSAAADPVDEFDAIVSQSTQESLPSQVPAVAPVVLIASAQEDVLQTTSDPADIFDAAIASQIARTESIPAETVSVTETLPVDIASEGVPLETSDPADIFDAAINASQSTQAQQEPAVIPAAVVETEQMPSDPADIFDAAINTSQQSQQPTEAPAVEPEIASGIDAQQVPSDPADIFDAAISQSQPAVTEAPSVLQPADVPAPITHEDTPVKDPSLLSQESTVEAEAPVSTASIEQPPAAATVEETAASLPELSVATTAAVDTASDFYTQLSGGGQDAVAAEVPVEVQPAREQAVGNAAEPVASHETAWGTLTTQAVAQEDGFSQVTTQPAQIPTSSVDSTGYDYSSFYNDQQDSAVDAGAAVAAVATIGVESLDQQTPTSDAFAAVLPETGLQQDPSAPFNAYNPYSSTGYSQAPATSSGFERVTDFSSPVGAVDAQQQQQQQQQDPTAVYGAYDPYSSAGYSQAPAVSAGFETVADLTVPADTSATDTYQQQQQQPQDPNVGYGAYDPYTSAGYSQAPVANGEYAAMDTTAVPAASAGDYQQQQQQPADTTQYGMYDPYSSAGYPDSSAPNGAFAAVDTQAIDRGVDPLQQQQQQQPADGQQFEETGYAPFDPYSSGGYAQNDTSNGQQFGTYDPYSPAGVYSQAPAEDGAAVPAVTSAEDDHQQQGYAMYDPYNPTGGYSQAPVANDGFTVGDTAKQTQPDSGSAYGTYDPYNPTGFQQQAPPQQGDYTSPQTMSPKFGGVSSPHGSAQMATPLSFGHPSDPHVQDTRSVMVPTAVAPPAGIFDLQSHSERTSTDLSFDRDVNEPSMEATALQDPLGRLHGQRPIMSFGFGGQLFTMFPRQVQRFNMYGNGSGGSASKLAPGMVRCQLLSEHIAPELSAQNESAIFSSPLLAGETARAALLKRRDVAVACAKAWVDHAKDSMSDEEAALYNAVVAVLESFSPADTAMPELTHAVNALTPLFAQTQTELSATAESATAPLTHGSPADLQELEELLLAGRREDAVALACRQGMWAHALIIASCTGKGLWQSVVSAYTEGVLHDRASPLGLQYRLFSGLGAQAIDPPRPFDKRDASAAVEFVTAADMRGSDIGANAQNPSAAQPDSALQDWAKTLALVLANRTPGDHSAILQLGDKLRQDRRILPAHICYALALHAKDVFLSDPARAVLLGANEVPTANDAGSFDARADRFSRFYRNQSAICLTELYEVAVALTAATTSDAQTASTSPAPQGSKPPIQVMCLPHLQAYKLYRAWWLVDCGQTALASRYCDAVLGILATLPQGVATPFIHASLVQGLRELRGRLTGAGMSSAKAAELVGDEAAIAGGQKSWLARAMPRPSFTSLMSAFDSSIDKFITGADGHRISLDAAGPTPGKYEVGPDKHAADRSSADFPSQPRALGAVNFDSRTPSPRAQQVPGESAGASSEPYVPMFAVSPKAAPSRTSTDMYRTSMDQPRSSMDHHYSRITSLPQQHQAPAWGDPGNASDLGNDGFIMPAAALGGLTPGFSAAPPVHPAMSAPTGGAPSPATGGAVNDDDDEDMFGFSKKPAKKPDTAAPRHSIDTRSSAPPASRPSTDSAVASSAAARKSTDAKPDAEAKDGSGVLGLFKSLWGGRKNQANLGDDSGFVYDPVQQRWVNKNAKEDQADQAPLPPPPPANMNFAPQSSSVPPPAQLGTPPASGHTPMMGAGGGVPPMMMGGSRPASAVPPMMGGSAGVSRAGTPAGKRRGARTKYVDLLNQ